MPGEPVPGMQIENSEDQRHWDKTSSANYNLRKHPMKKKPPILQHPTEKAVAQPDDRHWHNGGNAEIHMYAGSLRKAAKTLIATLDPQPNTMTAWDTCPVVLLYREAIELHLKALVDEGNNFLPSPTDSISLAKTHSLRWLAQIVGQIIKKIGWENEFKCEGVATLADFSALVSELEILDPVAVAVHPKNRRPDGWVPLQLQPPNVIRFAKKLDCLLDLLDVTADALAATWEKMSGKDEFRGGDDFGPTIH
jgi:hypothetical protein